MTRPNFYALSFCLLSACVPFLAVDMPRGLAFAPSLIGVVFYALYFVVFKTKPILSWKTLWLVLIIFGLSALSLSWALHFDVSLKQVSKLAILLPPQVLLLSLVCSLNKEQLEPYIRFFPYGVAFSALFLCFEVMSGGVVFNLVRGEPLDHFVGSFEFNRAAVVLSLYSFSALAILKAQHKHPLSFLIIILPLLSALIVTDSQSAQLSFVVGMVFLFLFPYHSRIAWVGLAFVILALMLTAPFFVPYIYQNYAADIQQIPGFAQAYVGHRLEIWDYVSRYALQKPLHGFGIEMTRATTNFDSGRIFEDDNSSLHPHNFAIQIWVEFGLIGILIAMGLMYQLFSSLQKNFTLAQQRIILPSIMGAMAPAAAAFGLWQGWWMATLFHLAAMCLIACKFTDDGEKEKYAPAAVAD